MREINDGRVLVFRLFAELLGHYVYLIFDGGRIRFDRDLRTEINPSFTVVTLMRWFWLIWISTTAAAAICVALVVRQATVPSFRKTTKRSVSLISMWRHR